MYKDKDIICLSTISWDFLHQRHQVLMSMFAQKGNKVYYVENINPSLRAPGNGSPTGERFYWGRTVPCKIFKRLKRTFIRKKYGNITVITPFILPEANAFFALINRKIIIPLLSSYLRARTREPVVWTYLATPSALRLIKSLKPERIIYDCVFDALVHPNSPKGIDESETSLIRSAGIVFTDNTYLFKKCSMINPNTHLVLPGVDQAFFEKTQIKLPGAISSIPKPRICFFGGIDQFKLDIGLIRYVARQRPDWNIILLGPVIDTDISSLKIANIFFEGAVAHKKLPAWLKEMDALILPYKIIPFSRSIFPAKIFECLASGQPVIATALEQLKGFQQGLIRIAGTQEEFVSQIAEALEKDSQEDRARRLNAAAGNSWESRFAQIEALIG